MFCYVSVAVKGSLSKKITSFNLGNFPIPSITEKLCYKFNKKRKRPGRKYRFRLVKMLHNFFKFGAKALRPDAFLCANQACHWFKKLNSSA